MRSARHQALPVLLLLALGFSGPSGGRALASDVEHRFGGRAFGNLYGPYWTADNKSLQQGAAHLWLEWSALWDDHWRSRAVMEGILLERPKDSLEAEAELNPREAYLRYSTAGWDLQAGKLLLPWGRADVINPTDYFSGKDLRIANPDEEVRRRGPWALLVAYTPDEGNSPVTLTAVWAPAPARSTLLIPPGLLTGSVQVNDPKASVWSRGAWGGKVSYAGEGWDGSLSGYHGVNALPDLRVAAQSLSGLEIDQVHHSLSAVGMDVAVVTGSYVLRAEVAYRSTEAPQGLNAAISPAYFHWVLGAERPIGDRFRVQLQGIYKRFPDFNTLDELIPATLPAERVVARANALLHEYQFQDLPGLTWRGTYTSEDGELQLEAFLLMYFPPESTLAFSAPAGRHELFFRPKASYEFSPGWKATLGLDHYAGSASQPLGLSAVYRSVFAELSFVF